MRGKITKRAVDALVPASSDQFLWDQNLKGFGLKVTPAGTKVYIFQYRRGGRNFPTQRVKIGLHGRLTPEAARKEATRLSGTIAAGNDPAAMRADERSAPNVDSLAMRFLSEHVATKTKPRTGVEYQRLVHKIILPALGLTLDNDFAAVRNDFTDHLFAGLAIEEGNRVASVSFRLHSREYPSFGQTSPGRESSDRGSSGSDRP